MGLIFAWELVSVEGGTTFTKLSEVPEAQLLYGASRGVLLRQLFSVSSLLGTDARDPLALAQLRMALLTIDKLIDNPATTNLFLQESAARVLRRGATKGA